MWKEDWRERPIFRDTDGLQVALDKALTYCKTRGDLIRLGRALGYAKKLEFYDLRRGSGKKLNEALTPEERNKTMGHRLGDSSTYVRYYMSDFIGADTQSIVFGSDLQTDLIHLMGRLQRHGDAPTKLTDEQRLAIHKDPKLARYCQKRRRAMEKFKREGYRSYTAAKDTQAGKQYNKYRKKAESLRKTLTNRRLDQAIKDFHDTIHAEEVDRQLQGTKPDAELLAPSTIKYELQERAEVARLFSQAADVTNREELHQLRLRLIVALSQLCKRRESPCRRRSQSGSVKTTSKMSKLCERSQLNTPSQIELGSERDICTGSTNSTSLGQPEALLVCPFCIYDVYIFAAGTCLSRALMEGVRQSLGPRNIL
ncbi:hypothetical protein VDGE_30545 [Verticillium dahliae]|uniref:Uncharacterized protein n=1 Tax=Verticillium dahliae TaxID=27337 RepID=A0A444RKN3_VERDA|nr:hypothetical protein VDGE_30545 [Verticillium dahliae]